MIRLITANGKNPNKASANESHGGLDALVESVCESYHIPASSVPEMKSGLENALYEYLSKFISDHNIKMNESTGVVIPVDDMLENLDESVNQILESTRVNGLVSLTHAGQHILSLVNISESITYQVGNSVDIDKLDSDSLLEAWKCDDIDHLRPLVTGVLSQIARKE